MKIIVRVGEYDTIRTPDTFKAAVEETNENAKEVEGKDCRSVTVYFGHNMDIVVCVATGKKLDDDTKTRIRKLLDSKDPL